MKKTGYGFKSRTHRPTFPLHTSKQMDFWPPGATSQLGATSSSAALGHFVLEAKTLKSNYPRPK